MYSITENIYCSQLSSVAILLQPEPNCFTSYNTRKWLFSLSLCAIALQSPPASHVSTSYGQRSSQLFCVHYTQPATQSSCQCYDQDLTVSCPTVWTQLQAALSRQTAIIWRGVRLRNRVVLRVSRTRRESEIKCLLSVKESTMPNTTLRNRIRSVYSRGSKTFIACAPLKMFHELCDPLHPN
jgi:hypothetical protein